MPRTAQQLRDDALAIWQAGVQAVDPATLIPEWFGVDGSTLRIGGEQLDLASIGRLVVVGAGKAGAAMALTVEQTLGPQLLENLRVAGWISVPANCVTETQRIRLHAARPAGANEPTAEGAAGSAEILQLVAKLQPRDVCLCLISGGGSALLPAPIEGFSLADKIAITREISARGGDIRQLNAVRRELSQIKGGGLARACRAGRLYSLILSDVLGDDLATIASGPTVLCEPTPGAAIELLKLLNLDDHPAGRRAIDLLVERDLAQHSQNKPATTRVVNLVIGNNATAVDAAGMEAERRGYSHAMVSATQPEGPAEDVAAHLVQMAQRMRDQAGPDCLISGGEPTVQLVPESERGLGGRNQQLCLEALNRLDDWRGLALLSGGTDGEDGPTDAAGAIVDEEVARRAREHDLDAADYLSRNDAYRFFQATGGLIKTGPTNTNVCDLRVVVVDRGDSYAIGSATRGESW